MPTKMQPNFNINADNVQVPSELFARMLIDDAVLWTVKKIPAELLAMTTDIQKSASVLLAPQAYKPNAKREAMRVLRAAISEFSIDGKNGHVANTIGEFVRQLERPHLIRPENFAYGPK